MNVITIESDAFEKIMQDIKDIKQAVTTPQKNLSEQWLSIQETCEFLHISIRTCAKYRYEGILPFSQIGDKIYFRASDLQSHLERNYQKAFKQSKF